MAEGLLRGQVWTLDVRRERHIPTFTVRFGAGRPMAVAATYAMIDPVTLRDESGAKYQMPDGVFRGGVVLAESGLVVLEHLANPLTGEVREHFGPGAGDSCSLTGLVLVCESFRLFEGHTGGAG